jgi:serine/threonine protein kinase
MTAGRTKPMPIAQVGAMIGGKLRVVRTIGQGAMGVVYEAHDVTLGRRVAVKVMAPEIVQDERKRRRFAREAGAASQLTSPNAVRVFEVSEERGMPYIVMEYLEGQTLEAILDRGPLPVASVADWMLQALDAIAEAHLRGLVHRDVKPGNIFLAEHVGRDPIVKMMDFGLVKDLDPNAVRLTKTGAPMGTPAYMAPEQIRAALDIDVRADVWSIGVTLHELLTGQLPFMASTLPVLLTRICQDEPAALRAQRPDIPPALEAIVARCLTKDRNGRYASAAEVAVALDAATIGLARTVRLQPRAPAPTPSAPHVAHARIPTFAPKQPRSSSRIPIFLAAMLAVLVLGGLALAALLLSRS